MKTDIPHAQYRLDRTARNKNKNKNSRMNSNVIRLLNMYARQWQSNRNLEKLYESSGISQAFQGIDKFGELLCSLLSPGYRGNGGGGSGHDLSNGTDAKEVKTVCWFQPWKCSDKSCERRTPYYCGPSCFHCKKETLYRVKDSRAGISAAAHIKDIDVLKNYMIVLIQPTDVHDEVSVAVWNISSDNAYFDAYVHNQHEHGSSTCNMIPGQRDFHMSGPVRMMQATMTIPEVGEPTVTEPDFAPLPEPVPWKVMNKEDKKDIEERETIPYSELKDKIVVPKKAHGKDRGKTTRRL